MNYIDKLNLRYRPWADKSEVPEFAVMSQRGWKKEGGAVMAASFDFSEESNNKSKAHFKEKFGVDVWAFYGIRFDGKKDYNFYHMVYSTDLKTWHPCGVKIA